MPKVTFVPGRKSVDVPRGTNLMTSIINADLPIGSSCGASGICAKCAVRIVSGGENVSRPSQLEMRLLRREGYAPDMRISCQTKVLGPVVVTTSYW